LSACLPTQVPGRRREPAPCWRCWTTGTMHATEQEPTRALTQERLQAPALTRAELPLRARSASLPHLWKRLPRTRSVHPCDRGTRRSSWEHLCNCHPCTGPWNRPALLREPGPSQMQTFPVPKRKPSCSAEPSSKHLRRSICGGMGPVVRAT
jgi:hypothetical protein